MANRDRWLLIVRRLAICAILVVALAPVVWLFSIAYKPTRDIFASPPTFLFTPTSTISKACSATSISARCSSRA